MTIDQRKRHAQKTDTKCGVFWLRNTRHIQQVGDSEPAVVHASPDHPVMVVLPLGKVKVKRRRAGQEASGEVERELTVPDSFLVPVKDGEEPPEPPKPTHIPPGGAGKKTKGAAEAFAGKKPEDEK